MLLSIFLTTSNSVFYGLTRIIGRTIIIGLCYVKNGFGCSLGKFSHVLLFVLLSFRDLSWDQLKGDISVLLPCPTCLSCPAFFGAHDKLEGTAANLFSRSDLDQVNPPLLGTRIPLPFSYLPRYRSCTRWSAAGLACWN